MARGQRTNPAEVLGEDQLGVQVGQRVRVQGIQFAAGRELRPYVLVDVARTHAAGVPAADNDCLVNACRGRLVALESHADQVIAQAKGIDDLRGGWQQ